MLEKWSLTRKVTTVVGGVGGIIALITGLFTLDDRYAKDVSVQTNTELLREIRKEVTINRQEQVRDLRRKLEDIELKLEMFNTAEKRMTLDYQILKIRHGNLKESIQSLKEGING